MGVNLWEDKEAWEDFLNWVEKPSKIKERIQKAYDACGNLLAYLGPDCGLRGVKLRKLAKRILRNTTKGLSLF